MSQDIMESLRSQKDLFKKYAVKSVSLFGSYARGEASEKSDVDLLVEYQDEKKVSLLDHAKLMLELSERLQKKIDLGTRSALRGFMKNEIEQECRLVATL